MLPTAGGLCQGRGTRSALGALSVILGAPLQHLLGYPSPFLSQESSPTTSSCDPEITKLVPNPNAFSSGSSCLPTPLYSGISSRDPAPSDSAAWQERAEGRVPDRVPQRGKHWTLLGSGRGDDSGVLSRCPASSSKAGCRLLLQAPGGPSARSLPQLGSRVGQEQGLKGMHWGAGWGVRVCRNLPRHWEALLLMWGPGTRSELVETHTPLICG